MLSTMEKIAFLRTVDLFRAMRGEDLVPVARIAQEVDFPAGTIIMRQGDPGERCYIIVQGEAQVVLDGVGPVAVRVAGSIIGEMALILRRPRNAHCLALTPLIALQIDHDDFWALIGTQPGLARGIMRILATRLDEAMIQLQRRPSL